jgi:hypothetical protein
LEYFFCGNFQRQKSWNSHQLRLGISPPARFGGPIARCDVTPVSGVSPTGPVGRRAAAPPSHRADEPPSARAPGKRAHLARTGPNDHSRRTARLRCPDAAVIRLLPPLVARPLTALGHSQWPEPPRFADATASSPAAVEELTPSRDPTSRPLRASLRRPYLSLRRRCMPLCGAETHLFFSHETIDASKTSASGPGAHVGRPAQTLHQKRAMRPATRPKSAWTARLQVGREH